MAKAIPSWKRRYFAEDDGEASLFYIAFGDIQQATPMSSQKYRCGGVPEGFEVAAYDQATHGDYLDSLRTGYLWDVFVANNEPVAQQVREAPGSIAFHGSQKNPATLDYLRDAVGMLTYFLDNGACAIYDPHQFKWWVADEWRKELFDPNGPAPRHHVVILVSDEEDAAGQVWLHTRGMRKFGKPDLSVHRVGLEHRDAAIDLVNRFIEYQAFGGVIKEGDAVRIAALPPGGVTHRRGDLEDPDFNNVHVSIEWPDPGLA